MKNFPLLIALISLISCVKQEEPKPIVKQKICQECTEMSFTEFRSDDSTGTLISSRRDTFNFIVCGETEYFNNIGLQENRALYAFDSLGNSYIWAWKSVVVEKSECIMK